MTWPRDWGGMGHASAIRVAVLAMWALAVAVTPYEAYAVFPSGLFESFGVGRLILGPDWVREYLIASVPLTVVKWLTVTACLCALILVRYQRGVTLVAFCGVLWLDSVTKGLGSFANHAQIAPLLALGLVAILGHTPFLTVPTRIPLHAHGDDAHAGTVWLIGMVTVLPYAFIGWHRLLTGGLDMFTGDVLLQYLSAASRGFASYPEWLDVVALRGWLNAGFLMTTALEASAPLLLTMPSYRRPWLLLMGLFHISTIWLMNIFFWENLVLLTVVFWWGWRPTRPTQEPGR